MLRKLTPEQIEEIAELREAGHSTPALAKRFNVSIGCISWHCLKQAAEPPVRKYRLGDKGPLIVKRGRHEVRRYTPNEDRQLETLSRQGLSSSEIGRRLNRKPNSINGRLMTLARREELAA